MSEERLIQFAPNLYRGPADVSFDELKAKGIKTILNLRSAWADLFGEENNLEAVRAEEAGIEIVHLHMSGWLPPNSEQLNAALHVLGDASKRPIFVHCLHGVDRTGVVVLAWRMRYENVPYELAYTEMLQRGFHRYRFFWWKPLLRARVMPW